MISLRQKPRQKPRTPHKHWVRTVMNGIEILGVNGEVNLTEIDVQDIRWLSGLGVKIPDLAREFDVHSSNIWKIVTNQTWRHV